MAIPLLPFSLNTAKKRTRWLRGLAGMFEKSMPDMRIRLYQADMDVTPREWCAIAIYSAGFYFVMLSVLIWMLGLMVLRPNDLMFMLQVIQTFPQTVQTTFLGSFVNGLIPLVQPSDIILPLGVGLAFSTFVLLYLLKWPNLVASRHVRSLEREMLTALHHMLIEVKSGVPLFNALVGVSEDYGDVSVEFRKVVREINAGMSEKDALDAASRRNPSLHFRRAIWQIVDAMRAGSSIAQALEAVVTNLVAEQVIAVRKYGQELNPYIMIYMLVSVIIPSLGITFLIILSSFSGINVPIIIFPVILVGLTLFQFFYMGMIRVKRPSGQV